MTSKWHRLQREREIAARMTVVRDGELPCPSCDTAPGQSCLHFDGQRSLPNHHTRRNAAMEINLATRARIEAELDAEGWTP